MREARAPRRTRRVLDHQPQSQGLCPAPSSARSTCLGCLPRGTHDYGRFLKPSEIAAFARSAGLETDALIGMTYNPFTKTYRLEADTSVNYIVSFRRDA